MAMEAESMQRYKSQSAVPGTSLAPMSGAAGVAQAKSKQPKDLTDTLMSQVFLSPYCDTLFDIFYSFFLHRISTKLGLEITQMSCTLIT